MPYREVVIVGTQITLIRTVLDVTSVSQNLVQILDSLEGGYRVSEDNTVVSVRHTHTHTYKISNRSLCLAVNAVCSIVQGKKFERTIVPVAVVLKDRFWELSLCRWNISVKFMALSSEIITVLRIATISRHPIDANQVI